MKIIELENGCYKKMNYYYKSEQIYGEFYYDSNNKLHRENGPAVIWYNENGKINSKFYWINGKCYIKEEYYKKLNIDRNLKLLNKV